ncbi:hypothetical protein NST17_06945 [Caldifermentibacillus hisashii]|uniref:Uncharacterized protein n=1 Tax=Caldifermentibacillus hisashii TaxID=996558 RepID=A0ABU9JVQ7_9BACI
MKTTTNYSLKKPELNDYVNVNDLNDNADKIDTELKKLSDAIGNLPDLNTNEKTALVLSINELLTKIGNISSLTTDKKNNLVDALNELKQHLTAHQACYVQHHGFGVTTNNGNAYSITLNPAPSSYVDGMGVKFKVNADSTGACTLNVDGLGAKRLKNSTGNDVTNLKANGIYTVIYNATTGNFILQGERGEYGTATPADVRNTKTLGTENGVVQGTLDLSLLLPSNIKKGITIDGVSGTLPYLPNDFIGARLYKKDTLLVTTASSIYNNIITANNLLIFIAGGNYNCYRYDIVNKTLTNLGIAWPLNVPMGLCASDDGSVIYVRDSNGAVYYWNGVSWVSTGITAMVAPGTICCSPDGGELYYLTGTTGGMGTLLKKFVKSAGNVSTIAAIDKLLGEQGLMRYVDDGSVWVGVNESPATYKKIRISDGVIVATINRPGAFTRNVCMFRKSSYPYYGVYYGSSTGSDGLDNVYMLNKDGTSTQTSYSVPYGRGSFMGSLTGEFQAFKPYGGPPYSIQFLQLQKTQSVIASCSELYINQPVSALSEDGYRWAVDSYAALYSYYPYQ